MVSIVLWLVMWPAFGEGTSEMGEAQRLLPLTKLKVDIVSGVESISWEGHVTDYFGVDHPADIDVYDPAGVWLGTYASGSVIPASGGAGVYDVRIVGMDLFGAPLNPDDPPDSGPPDGEFDPLAAARLLGNGGNGGSGVVNNIGTCTSGGSHGCQWQRNYDRHGRGCLWWHHSCHHGNCSCSDNHWLYYQRQRHHWTKYIMR